MTGAVPSDLALRRRILRHFAEQGTAPDLADRAAWGVAAPREALRRLHAQHALVVGEAGGIAMAHPFSGGHHRAAGPFPST